MRPRCQMTLFEIGERCRPVKALVVAVATGAGPPPPRPARSPTQTCARRVNTARKLNEKTCSTACGAAWLNKVRQACCPSRNPFFERYGNTSPGK